MRPTLLAAVLVGAIAIGGCSRPTPVGRWTSEFSDEAGYGNSLWTFRSDAGGEVVTSTTSSSGLLGYTHRIPFNYEIKEEKFFISVNNISGGYPMTDVYVFQFVNNDTLILQPLDSPDKPIKLTKIK